MNCKFYIHVKGKIDMENNEKKKVFQKDRTISFFLVVAGLAGFLVAIAFDLKAVITVVLSVLAAMANFEIVRAVGNKNKILFAVSCSVSFLTVMLSGFGVAMPSAGVLYGIYVLLLMSLMVFFNKEITFTHTSAAFVASLALPFAFSCFLKLNNIADWFDGYTHEEGIYFVGLAFSCSWLTDTFAYIVGVKFGKHKMAPVISPKKSIEGAIGGVVITALFNVLILYLFTIGCKNLYDYTIFGESAMKYVYIIPISMVLSLVSMLGDLSASVIKRNYGIKDYGKLIPGHGGIMDRFDSCIFVAPTLYCILSLITFFKG